MSELEDKAKEWAAEAYKLSCAAGQIDIARAGELIDRIAPWHEPEYKVDWGKVPSGTPVIWNDAGDLKHTNFLVSVDGQCFCGGKFKGPFLVDAEDMEFRDGDAHPAWLIDGPEPDSVEYHVHSGTGTRLDWFSLLAEAAEYAADSTGRYIVAHTFYEGHPHVVEVIE